MRKFLAIDVGGTGIKYALMNEDATIISLGEAPTPKTSLDDFLDTLESIYKIYEAEEPEALVMSAPGRIDDVNGFFHTGGALTYLHETDLKTPLAERIPLPFSVLNDAKAAAQAEVSMGSLKGHDSGIVITLGTGIGGAVVMNGKVQKGASGAAGEFSGIPTVWNTRLSGEEENWTQINCVKAMVSKFANRKGLNPDETTGKDFFEALNAGDQIAAEELDWYCETLVNGLIALQMILDVEKVSLGGGISRQPALIEAVNRKMDTVLSRLPEYVPISRPEIGTCTFFNEANLLGALEHYLTAEAAEAGREAEVLAETAA